MSYSTQSELARDNSVLMRVSACASTCGVKNPQSWAWEHQWELSAQPGWDTAYSYALANNKTDVGNDESVITDGMILAAVEAILQAESAGPA
jgi:hypothetical protein